MVAIVEMRMLEEMIPSQFSLFQSQEIKQMPLPL